MDAPLNIKQRNKSVVYNSDVNISNYHASIAKEVVHSNEADKKNKLLNNRVANVASSFQSELEEPMVNSRYELRKPPIKGFLPHIELSPRTKTLKWLSSLHTDPQHTIANVRRLPLI